MLSVPGAQLHATPDGAAGEAVTPFTAFYVYAREPSAGSEWLQVGTDRHGGVRGWLKGPDTIDWAQGLTVAFREAVGRDRALLFRDADSVRELAKTRDLDQYSELYRSAEAGEKRSDSPVVAIQPPGKLDIQENFYLVPILRHEDLYLGSEQARLLQVSSVPLESDKPLAPSAAEASRPPAKTPIRPPPGPTKANRPSPPIADIAPAWCSRSIPPCRWTPISIAPARR